MLKRYRNICILLVGFLFAGHVSAQFNLNKYNGLPSDHVYMFLRDQYGYLWIATDKGVLRYNGYEFKLFDTSQELGSNDVWRIYKDRKHRIWLFSFSKVFGYIYNNKYYKVIDGNEVINPGWHVYESENGLIFPGQRAVTEGSVADSSTILYQESYPAARLKSRQPVYTLERDLLNDHVSLFAFDGKTFTRKKEYTCTAGMIPPMSHGMRISRYRNHAFFYVRRKDRLVHLDLELGTCREITGPNHTPKNFSYIQPPENRETDPRDYVYLYYAAQVDKLDSALRVIRSFAVSELTRPGVSGYDLVYLLEDSVWGRCVATESHGGFISPEISNPFKPATWDVPAGFSFVSVTNHNTAYWWNEQTHTLARMSPGKPLFQKRYPWVNVVNDVRLYNQQQDNLFIFHDNHKVNKQCGNVSVRLDIYMDTTGRTKASRAPRHYMISNRELYVTVLLPTNQGFRQKLLSGKFNELVSDPVRNGHWAYNHHALYFINSKDSCTDMSPLLKKTGIAQLEKLLVDPYGNLILLSPDKLTRYDPATGSVSELLPHCNLSDVRLALCAHTLVVAGRFGVAFLKTEAPAIYTAPYIYHNIKDDHYMFVNRLLVLGNQVLMQTDKGSYQLDLPREEVGHATNELPYSFLVHYNDSTYMDASSGIDVDQLKNVFRFDLVRPAGNGALKYSYRIEGLDTTWHELNANELVLPPLDAAQTYTLSMVAKDAVWKSHVMQIQLYVKPFWWQSAPGLQMIWIGALLAAGAIVFTTVLTTRNLIVKRTARHKQLLELELKAVYAQINPHFIFNTLNSGLHFIKKQKTDEAYRHILRFSQLLRAYLKASRNRYITLADEITNLQHYIKLQQTRFGQMFQYSILLHEIPNPEAICIPSLLLQPIVENAIEHGLLPKEEQGHLEISFRLDVHNKQLTCTISDNGIGRSRSKAGRNPESKKESYGNDLIRELVSLFNKYEKMGIEIKYEDVPEPATGTIVKIVIKNPQLCYE